MGDYQENYQVSNQGGYQIPNQMTYQVPNQAPYQMPYQAIPATSKRSLLTFKWILRALLTICIVLFFCPAFIVSCSGQDLNISAINVVGGISTYGQTISDPQPVMLLCLFIPVLVLILLCIKRFAGKGAAAIVLGCTIIDMIIWFVFCFSAQMTAEENYCSFKVTCGFIINIVILILISVISVIVLVCKIKLDTDLLTLSNHQNQYTPATMNLIIPQQTMMPQQPVMSQQTMMPQQPVIPQQSVIETQDYYENVKFCRQCGTKLSAEALFCTNCGTRV